MNSALISVKLFDEATIHVLWLGKVPRLFFSTEIIQAITSW